MIPMACAYPVILVSLLLVLPTIQGVHEDEVVYGVTNNALDTMGGKLFRECFTEEEAKQLMKRISHFVWNWVLRQEHSSDRTQVKEINLIISKSDQWRLLANGLGNGNYEVHINEKHIYDVCVDEKDRAGENVRSWKLKMIVRFEVKWMLTFGIAQHLQWKFGDEPRALWHGIAAYAVMAAGYESDSWAKDGEGDTWDQMFDVTGRFFCYINKTIPHFVADLNKKMKTSYSSSYFKDVTGKTIGEWWSMYKKHYQNA